MCKEAAALLLMDLLLLMRNMRWLRTWRHGHADTRIAIRGSLGTMADSDWRYDYAETRMTVHIAMRGGMCVQRGNGSAAHSSPVSHASQ